MTHLKQLKQEKGYLDLGLYSFRFVVLCVFLTLRAVEFCICRLLESHARLDRWFGMSQADDLGSLEQLGSLLSESVKLGFWSHESWALKLISRTEDQMLPWICCEGLWYQRCSGGLSTLTDNTLDFSLCCQVSGLVAQHHESFSCFWKCDRNSILKFNHKFMAA